MATEAIPRGLARLAARPPVVGGQRGQGRAVGDLVAAKTKVLEVFGQPEAMAVGGGGGGGHENDDADADDDDDDDDEQEQEQEQEEQEEVGE